MFLAVDIGNSNIVIATWSDGAWNRQWRLETRPLQKPEDYKRWIEKRFAKAGLQPADITTIALSSVVPAVTPALEEALIDCFAIQPYVLRTDRQSVITVAREDPARVGTDLIADAAGAYTLVKDDCITVDFGTATTIMAIKKPGALYGGAICAGLKVTASALIDRAAQLHDIPLEPPPSVLGGNATETLQSGLIFGHLCMVEGLIERMKQELGPVKVVVTGGLASTLAPYTDCFDYIEPMLTLDGLRIIAERQ